MIIIDEENGLVTLQEGGEQTQLPMKSAAAFEAVSKAWLRCGWDTKHVYTFTWMGRPVIQLPEDMLRIQEVIYQVKPDVLIETGVAHGGSLIFYASLFKAMEKGRVIGVDIEIRPHNRKAIEAHPLNPWISLVEGSSTATETVDEIKAMVKPGETVMVVLDSCHSYEHVLNELEAYAPMVTSGSYIVATDGIMKDVVGAPRSQPDWATNNPHHAAIEFASRHSEFVHEQPQWLFNESEGLTNNITYWPAAWLKRR